MNRRFSLLGTVALLALTLPIVRAVDVPTDPNTDPVNVIVSAEAHPQLQSESIASSTIITAHDLEVQGAKTVADALRIVPGVTIVQSGQEGSLSQVQIRGTKSYQTLVLIDGLRISSPAFIGMDLSKFPVSNISRIEIIRGPVSSLYGSDAFGGVINIITKRPVGTGGGATLSVGSHGRTERSFDISDGNDKIAWQFNASAPGFNGERPNSDFVAADYTGKIQFSKVSGWDFTLHAEHYNDALGVAGSVNMVPGDERQWWQRDDLSFTATRALDNGMLTINAHRLLQSTKDQATTPYAYTSSYQGNTYDGNIRYARNVGAHQLVVGVETRTDTYRDLESSGGSVDNKINNRAFFVEDRWALAKDTSLLVGARQDQHSFAGVHLTPRIGISHNVGDGLTVRSSYSEGFRSPNFSELYGNSLYYIVGNPDLKPETSHAFEIGATLEQKSDSYDVALFSNRVFDQITPVANSYQNIAHVQQQGAELSWNHVINNEWKTGMSYSYLEANNADTGARLPRLAHNKVSMNITGSVAKVWNTTLSGRYTDGRPDISFKSDYTSTIVTLPARAVFDLNINRSRFALDKESKLMMSPYLMIRNIANTPGEEIADYPAESRSAEVGVRLYW